MTQADLAAKSGIDSAMLSRFETGKLFPGPELLAKLRKALDWTEEAEGELAAVIGEMLGRG